MGKKGMECEFVGYSKNIKTTIRGIESDDIRRGMVLCKPGSMKACDQMEAQVYVLNKDEGGRTKPFIPLIQMQMFSKTWDCAAQIDIKDKEMVMPGEDSTLILRLLKPMVVEKGQRFTLRDGMLTLGTGVVTKVLPRLSEDERVGLSEGKKGREKTQTKRK